MDDLYFIEVFKNILIIDFLRYFIPAGLAFSIFWVLLKKQFQHRFIQNRVPKQKQLWSEFKYSMSTVVIFAIIGVGIFILENSGYLRIYKNINEYGIFYFVLSLIIAIVFHDFYFYWTHRWMHHPRIYKHVHLVHHKSISPSPWAAYSFHPYEAVIQALVLPILLFVLPMHGLSVFIFLIYMIIRNVLGHLGYELFSKGFTKKKWLNWHTTTTHHSMHHQFFNCNYGLYFSWWDKLMKTEHTNYNDDYDNVTNKSKIGLNKNLIILFFATLSNTFVFSQSPEGKWITYNEQTGKELSIVSINFNKEKNVWYATIDSILLQPDEGLNPICIKCTGKYKNQKIIGMEILSNFRNKGSYWQNGSILDPSSGESYKGKIEIKNDSVLIVHGYGGPLNLFSRSQTWVKESKYKGIVGLWKTIDGNYNLPKSLVELKVIDRELKGIVRKIFLLPYEGNYPICTECKKEFKNKPIVGMVFMNNFKQSGDKWINGQILDPSNGNTYNSKFWFEGYNNLKIRGFFGPFYRTQTWKRL